MKLIKCHVDNFGRLHDLDMDFGEGLFVICEENGWGKSTFAEFLKTMFYGFDTDSKRSSFENRRKRYFPWQGGIYGGKIIFESGGKRYELTRNFGEKAADDFLSVRDTNTNLPVTDFDGERSLGEALFQIDSEAFGQTVFISQGSCEVKTNSSIDAKIGNLSEFNDDLNKFEDVDSRLDSLMRELKKRGGAGRINEVSDQLSELEYELKGRAQIEENAKNLRLEVQNAKERKKTLSLKQSSLSAEYEKLSERKDREGKLRELKRLTQEVETKTAVAKADGKYFPERIPSAAQTEEFLQYGTLLSAKEEAVSEKAVPDEETLWLKQVKEEYANGFPGHAQTDAKRRDLEKISALKLSLAASEMSAQEKEELERLGERFKSASAPTSEEIKEKLSSWNLKNEKESQLPAKRQQLAALKELERKKEEELAARREEDAEQAKAIIRRNIIWLILMTAGFIVFAGGAAVLIFADRVTGVLVMTAGAALAAAGFIIRFAKKKSAEREIEEEDNTEAKETASDLLRAKTEREEEKEAADTAEEPEEYVPDISAAELSDLIAEDEAFAKDTKDELSAYLVGFGYTGEAEAVADELYELKSAAGQYQKLVDMRDDPERAKQQTELSALENGVEEFLNAYSGDAGEDLSFEARLNRLEENAERFNRASESVRKWKTAQIEADSLRKKIIVFIQQLGFTPEDDLQGQLLDIQRHAQIAEAGIKAKRKAEEDLAAFEEKSFSGSEELGKALIDMEEMSAGAGKDSETLVRLSEDVNQTAKDIIEIENLLMKTEDRFASLSDKLKELDDKQLEYERLKEEEKGLNHRYSMLRKTQELLRQSRDSFTAKYTGPLLDAFKKYYGMLTEKNADGFYLDSNMNLTVDEMGRQRETCFFSAGWRDLYGICLRLAIIDAMYGAETPFIIMDDPFADLDDAKQQKVRDFLKSVSEKYQIIYFTCHKDLAL